MQYWSGINSNNNKKLILIFTQHNIFVSLFVCLLLNGPSALQSQTLTHYQSHDTPTWTRPSSRSHSGLMYNVYIKNY